MAETEDPIDLVYTWVDDGTPGYLEVLNRHAADPRDRNPDRTRDNLDLIRYSLRSVAQNLPWIRNIHLVSMRPQVPPWLNRDHPQLRLVHHDQIMDARVLPTFNSFAIVSHLHLLPGLSRHFLYVEDDMLVMTPQLRPSLFAPDGRPYVHLKPKKVVPRDRLDPATARPWNLALANADAALSQSFGPGPRDHLIHGPQILDREVCARMVADYPDLIAATRTSRFRAGDNVPPEFLARHLALETGAAVRAPWHLSRRVQGYMSIENLAPWTWAQLTRLRLRRPQTVTLNDSFGAKPNPRVEAMVKRQLEAWFPKPSPYETPATN
ncbi:MAG: stealth conserved region 3 domain-containing protein [Rhodobacter sp.]|nr:stealth conserved region 3 domain-containing protein [Rhodobacter sp.]